MNLYELPYDPEEWYFGGPPVCPRCGQGILEEEPLGNGTVWTCYSLRHPMYACHTRYWVPNGTPKDTIETSLKLLTELSLWDPFVTIVPHLLDLLEE